MSGGRVLIIDDEAALRKTLARILKQAGFEVTTAENGEQALAFIKSTSFDLVYMDLRMPGMYGLDVLKIIRDLNPTLPVVLFTAQPDLHSALEAMRSGATDYLLKPLKPQTIIERTRVILANQQKENRRREISLQIEALQSEIKMLDAEPEPAPSSQTPIPSKDRYLKRGVLVFDIQARRLTINERFISLPPTSFDYLLVLARHAPDVVDYRTLVAEAQGFQADVREAQELTKWHIHQVRQAIEDDAHNPSYLINVRGTGYRLVAD